MTKEEMIDAIKSTKDEIFKEIDTSITMHNSFIEYDKEDLENMRRMYYRSIATNASIGLVSILLFRSFLLGGYCATLAGINLASYKNEKRMYDLNKESFSYVRKNIDKVPTKRDEVAKLKKEKEILESFSEEEFQKALLYKM